MLVGGQVANLGGIGVDLIQEHILGQGSQKDEGMVEKFKDEQIAGAIRGALGMNRR